MKTFPEEKVGPFVIRIAAVADGYAGILVRHGKQECRLDDDDLDRLRARLRNEAGRLHPDYFGMDGAIARFLRFFPDGFDDRAFINERGYKAEAQQRLQEIVSVEAAIAASPEQAIAVRSAFTKTNILHSTEFARAHEVLSGADGAAYVRAAARFTQGEIAAGLAGMVAAIAPHGRASWPLLTYLPSLWRPDRHMFLKPEVTNDYAYRIGHPFQFAYAAEPRQDVYDALLALVADTETATQPLGSRDRTDVQSFIWVVGSYTDAVMPLLEKLRANG